MVTISAENVGGEIVEWHSCLVSREISQAKILKSETEELIKKMEPNDKMLAYYQLVSFYHDILISNRDNKPIGNLNLNEIDVRMDDYLNFMYYYVSGQHEFFQGRYKSAIRTYKIAERLIEKVEDLAEKAEFYQKLGISYYQIDQYTFAFSYIEQALEFFEKNDTYKINEITCKMVLAAINTEMRRFEEAEEIYSDLQILSKPYPFTQSLVFHNIGQNRMSRNILFEAQDYFSKALLSTEFYNSRTGYKARYNLVNVNIRANTYTSGLDELEKEVNNNNMSELAAKCQITRGLYLQSDPLLVEEGLSKLEELEEFFECFEIGLEISDYYKSKDEYKTALRYALYSLEKAKSQTILGVDQT
ncbi:Rap family tetratricopeptide repeat protein [Bacillus sp. Marseille-P3800]|uniref:Rap family tetratricopeptide repeat protein n=1 Tax=Bacillus sp. Marseille-P3800 TaxID=2014782 RepID=UPI000C0889CD|nr:Rap family tetratricopeptide repeat protein [Bacillus sp. Marseille-P3800]